MVHAPPINSRVVPNLNIELNPMFVYLYFARVLVCTRAQFAGIWFEWADEVKSICAAGDLTVTRVHTHIGSGSDPAVWQKVTKTLGTFFSYVSSPSCRNVFSVN